jgi:hypothetical protein
MIAYRLFALAFCVGMIVNPIPAIAHLPPPRPPQFEAYGPIQICTNNYAIEVGPDEAVHASGDIVRIINDRELIALKLVPIPTGNFARTDQGSIHVAEQVRAFRYPLATPDNNGTLAYASRTLEPKDIRYALIDRKSNSTLVVLVGATSFRGEREDKAILQRIRPLAEKLRDCIHLNVGDGSAAFSSFLTWDLTQTKPDYGASIFPKTPDAGPVFHCFSGIGFLLRDGEKLRRAWRSLGPRASTYSHVIIGDTYIKFEGDAPGFKRKYTDGSKEHPIGPSQTTEITYSPSRETGPPYAPAGVREDGSWEVKLAAKNNYGIRVRFPASAKTGVGFSFLERLEFVEDGDPRCQKYPDGVK